MNIIILKFLYTFLYLVVLNMLNRIIQKRENQFKIDPWPINFKPLVFPPYPLEDRDYTSIFDFGI